MRRSTAGGTDDRTDGDSLLDRPISNAFQTNVGGISVASQGYDEHDISMREQRAVTQIQKMRKRDLSPLTVKFEEL